MANRLAAPDHPRKKFGTTDPRKGRSEGEKTDTKPSREIIRIAHTGAARSSITVKISWGHVRMRAAYESREQEREREREREGQATNEAARRGRTRAVGLSAINLR